MLMRIIIEIEDLNSEFAKFDPLYEEYEWHDIAQQLYLKGYSEEGKISDYTKFNVKVKVTYG